MKRHIQQLQTLCFLLLLTLSVTTASGQDNIEWNVAIGDYSDPLNWNPDFVPDAMFQEQASINNDGLAFVVNTPITPFSLSIGRTAGNSGTVEIRSGGNLAVVQLEGSGGQTFVGQNGEGHLTILPGGSLTTESLSSGGAESSVLTLGGPGAGTASLTVNGSSSLQRNTSILGSNVAFSTNSLSFGSGHRLNVEITSNGLTPIDVSGTASLNGTLNVNFDGVTPSAGDSWDFLDAGSISGDFRAFESSVSLSDGLGLVVTQQPGGANGTLGKIALEAQLLLSVDRGSGAVSIENRASSSDLDIDGYGIISPEGALNISAWTSLNSQGDPIWRESNETSFHVSELILDGSRVVSGGTTLSMGDLYSFTPTELGVPYPALQFEYHLAQTDEVRTGRVEMVGPENDVVLVVDPDTGEAAIQNQSPFDLAIDAYGILSASGSIDVDGWTSLQASGDDDWRASNPTPPSFGAQSFLDDGTQRTRHPDFAWQPVRRGLAFGDAGLVFEFRLDSGEIRLGTVRYDDPLVFEICGDFDQDGDVDVADRTIQTQNWTGALEPGDPNANKTFPDGDCDGDGDVDVADQTGTIQNWTGAMAGNLEDGDDADLVYNPANGNVTLDGSDTASGLLLSFVVGTDQSNMRTENTAFPFINVGTNTDNQPFQIGQTDPLNQGAGPEIDLGDVFPTGMTLEGLSEYLTLAEYASELGAGGTFDLRVIPEPASGLLAVIGLLAIGFVRRRRIA